MKTAIISDIHGNLEAFREVLDDIGQTGADAVVSLGDNVGYGPDPEAVVQLIRSRNIPSIMGNHELAIVLPERRHWFNESARMSLAVTEKLLTEETKQWIDRLETTLVFRNCLFVHGCPPDSVTAYLFEMKDSRLKSILGRMDQRICFVGHTHTLDIVSLTGGEVVRSEMQKGKIGLAGGGRHIINVGSVGQPRDGDKSAKYVIWDDSEETIETRFIPYNAAKTAEKIIALGFPKINATRLL